MLESANVGFQIREFGQYLDAFRRGTFNGEYGGGPMGAVKCVGTHMGTYGAAITMLISPATTAGRAAADTGATVVALEGELRRCDFGHLDIVPMVAHPGLGTGSVLVRKVGSAAVAEVHLEDAPDPYTHFEVGLIQVPRPSSATCGPGDPGTAFTGFDTDATGGGTVTVQDEIRQGTTGVWVIVERPNANSQNPAEFYTSEFVAPV